MSIVPVATNDVAVILPPAVRSPAVANDCAVILLVELIVPVVVITPSELIVHFSLSVANDPVIIFWFV